MKSFFTFILVFISIFLVAQSPGDTIVVETYNYTQTHGVPWDGTIRDTMIDFPDDPEITYEKIIMLYNMRCKNGLVSTTSDRNKGCGEWDYSCNTYIHDSSRVDSVLSFTNSHNISNFSGGDYNYIETPTYDYYQYRQKNVQLDATNSESLSSVGDGSLALLNVIKTDQHSGKSQFLLTQAELTAAGVIPGDINALLLEITGTADAEYFIVNIKSTDKTSLDASNPDLDGFTEVYFRDFTFTSGTNRIQFHTPFNWNGTSNLIVEFTFTNNVTSDAIETEGNTTAFVSGIYTNNGTSLNNVNGEIDVPVDPFSTITDEVTISFWSYGNPDIQPVHNYLFHGIDADGYRTINMHHPWGNSNIYFDCGNNGSTYDRINKEATPAEYEGSWSHWAVTKNTNSGEMHIYHNGVLWHSGTDKTLLIDIQDFIIGNTQGGTNRYYYGKIDEVRIWDAELSETTISEWMYKSLDNSHPDYIHLVAYYKIDEGNGNTTIDASVHAETGQINGYMYWVYDRGNNLNRDFKETMNRPNITFAQGDYDLTVSDVIVTDSVVNIPNIVKEYEIIPRWGTMHHDSINTVSISELWEAVYEVIYDPEGIAIDSALVDATGSVEITELSYYKRYPMWFEIMSFVTPYGIWLDLGMDGKTWIFDVTDYAPILKGSKRMTVERGGQWQEDMDIKFLFIVGTPPRDVLDVNQLWRADSKGYTDIIADRAFEARDVAMHPDGEQFKIRSTITGHGQQGEFSARYHFIEINGNEEFNWRLWTECSTNPVYPQGGTWIYDRAGWCPGQGSDLYEYDITEFVTPGQTANINYGLEYANGTSNYIVNNQLVTYGGPNFTHDASVLQVLKPNALDAKNDRFNPACTFPEIVIQNTGSATLTSLDIEYYEEGGESIIIPWSGSLDFMEVDTVVLPVSDVSFWLPTSNIFVATVSNPNGQEDQYEYNNTYKTYFEGVDIYPEGEILKIVCKTNNYGWQTHYTLYDGQGDAFLEWDNLDDNTIYETPLILPSGCYKLQINDRNDDGLTWWHNSTQGSGYLRIRDNDNNTMYNFETEFGRFAIYEFGVGEITSVPEVDNSMKVAVYPNPVTDQLNLQFAGVKSEKINVRLMNSMTSVLFEKEYIVNGSRFDNVLNMNKYPRGIYLLEVTSGTHSEIKKIIKQ